MQIASGVMLRSVVEALRAERPVFHSEADMQQAFAWCVQRAMPTALVRLETRPAPGVRLDVLVTSADGCRRSAIELKYLTRAWTGTVDGERFELKNQGAQDIRAYDVVKDIGRVEHDTQVLDGCNGAVVVLSNEQAYWSAPRHDRVTNATAFRLHEGRRLSGSHAWGPDTGAGTSRGRELAIDLTGTYQLHWNDYSDLPGLNGRFRYLEVEVPGPSD